MTRDVRNTLVSFACLIVALGGFLLWRGVDLIGDVADLNADVANLSAAYEEARQDDPSLPPAEEVIDEPAPRDGVDGRDGRDGRDGKDGESPACLLLITQCVGATGAQGVQGIPGRPPTDAEVYAQVAAWFEANPADGEGPPGPQGPGPTDEQIAAAVERYCSTHDGCRGPAGRDGQTCLAGYEFVAVKFQGNDIQVCMRT